MRINAIGHDHVHGAEFCIDRPSGSGDWLLLLLKTPAVFFFDGAETVTEADSFILYRKGTPQLYKACGGHYCNDWFHFSLDEGGELPFGGNIPLDRVIRIGDLSSLSAIVKDMCYEYYSSDMHRDEAVKLYFRLFFLKLSEKIRAAEDDRNDSYYGKMSVLRSDIYNSPAVDRNVDDMARSLSMSRSYFQHVYKQLFGISVVNDVIRSRIEHSRYLLSTTDISITRIAAMCGYRSDLHFFRQFKSRMRMTPSEYRRAAKDEGAQEKSG